MRSRVDVRMDRFVHVHPIERLRYVARSGWAGSSVLASEAAWALADLAETEAPALVPACRRLLDRQPGCGPLWWVAARVLGAGDPVAEAQRCAEALEEDATPELVIDAVPEGARVVRRGGVGEVASADLVVVEVDAFGATGMVVEASSVRLLASANAVEVPVWVEAGVGRVLPPRIWEAMSQRIGDVADSDEPAATTTRGSRTHHDHDVRFARDEHGLHITYGEQGLRIASGARGTRVDHIGVEKVVGPKGARSVETALADTDCPEPPELLEAF